MAADSDRRAFTLVELLFVIGIIVILIALLLPAITGAQRAAQRTECAAQLQQILNLAHNHAVTHDGYLPLAGILSVTQTNPAGLHDPLRARYDYVNFAPFGITDALMCFSASFAADIGDDRILRAQNVDDLNVAQLDPRGFLRLFRCPSHLPEPGPLYGPGLFMGNPATVTGSWLVWLESQSYIYNETALGWDDQYARSRGEIARVRNPAQTMLLADGLGGNATRSFYGFGTIYNKTPIGPVSVADALLGDSLAGDPQNFDAIRHQGKMNIGFFDGHVETRYVSKGDLANIYLVSP